MRGFGSMVHGGAFSISHTLSETGIEARMASLLEFEFTQEMTFKMIKAFL